MARRKENLTNVGNFRTAERDFFQYSVKWDRPTHKEESPFIFFNNGKVECIERISEVLQKIENKEILLKDTLLKTWVGRYRSDVFTFKVSELLNFLDSKKK